MENLEQLKAKTIQDFGEQWTRFTDNTGYYASLELFEDHVAPFLKAADFSGKAVADIGSGTGRIVRMLADAGATRILAVEPSEAMHVLKENTKDISDRVEYFQISGEKFPAEGDLDFVVSFGVLHHIPDPLPVLKRAHEALKTDGKVVAWMYGKEGNRLYLSFALPLRTVTTRLSHDQLKLFCRFLRIPLAGYIGLCRHVKLPMHEYMTGHIGKLDSERQVMTIYDQLNPAWARYYTKGELQELFTSAGFKNLRFKNRHGYSWTVIGEK